ncbi:MAG: vitamin B12-dependent ribonucleotide reductase, partial [Desulfovibrionaceae bacterium]|nr:vitamin B12-dependent ribonucleotide reductase [Desulfovibrionaceae bacterium]
PWHDRTDELARTFYDLMADGIFLPNSPTLMNAGLPLGQLAACFVLPVGDSIEEIFDAVKFAAMIHKSGGGTGFSFSRLRPKGSRVGTTGGVASGPVSFLRIFNTATEQIKQGGTRRGANMGILRVDHPDILEFICAKEREGEFNNFNLSVGLTEDFMRAAEKRADYDLVEPHTGKTAGSLNAGEVFDLLVKKAWQSGDPGIVFLDRINHDNPVPAQGDMEATNPCGEQPLLPYEACNLGSINLARLVRRDWTTDAAPADRSLEQGLDWQALSRTVRLAVRFLDNVIDASRYPLPVIAETVRRNRKIGLGVMGFADMLFELGIPYASEEGVAAGERVMTFIREEGRAASRELARERGAFPAFEESVYAGGEPLRNATITTIAPTGTLSLIAGCSSGIEPIFALCFTRNVLGGEKLTEINAHCVRGLTDRGLLDEQLLLQVKERGSIQGLGLPERIERVYATAQEIAPHWHLAMQAACQKGTDNAVSKTVNLPNQATEDDVRECYLQAWSQGCKGVTIYRDGCKSVQVLSAGGAKKDDRKDAEKAPEVPAAAPAAPAMDAGQGAQAAGTGWDRPATVRSRPDVMRGFTHRVQTGLGTLYLTVNEMDGRPFEVFATIGKSGHSVTAKAEAIGRLVSLALRSGVAVEDIITQLSGIGGEHPVYRRKGLLLSIPDAVAWVLESHYGTGAHKPVQPDLAGDVCPECGGQLTRQEGCMVCQACGFSRCG